MMPTTKPLAALLALSALLSLAHACAAPPAPPTPLTLEVDRDTLEANGADQAILIARVPPGTAGVVVRFSSSGGLLASSAVAPDEEGVARTTLFADEERALLGRPDKPVTVRATVSWDVNLEDSATVDVLFVAPVSGAPSLSLRAQPPAALADGAARVQVTLSARRLPAGTRVALASTAGALSTDSVVVENDGAGGTRAEFEITAPAEPAVAMLSAREPSGVEATLAVHFVADGQAQFDLTGTFAQLAPARVKMTAGTLTPNPQCVIAPTLVKVELVQRGADIIADYTTCFVTLAPVRSIVGEVTNTAPPAFTDAIPVVHAEFTLAEVALGALYDPPASVVVAGAALDDADQDSLPTSEDDERVRDADGDGRPGVTVINSVGGEQNITFRNRGDTRGVIESGNRIVGSEAGDLSALPESSVLGAGNAFLPDFESVPSVFEMVRVDGRDGAPDLDTDGDGEISCREIVDAQAFLFTLEAPATPLDCAGVH